MARSHILVAVSGGADSMALLHSLHQAAKKSRWRLTVAHLNHGIRGKAAGEDAAFVEAMARRLRIPCVVGQCRVPALAKRKGISLEMAAREARYAFLARTARSVKADCVATAHTADDQVETILLKLVRGAGRGGLSGMAAQSLVEGLPLVRPLLDVSRGEIESFLRERGLSWREDESNRDAAFLRNRVRHELLPFLEKKFNPRIREAVLRTGEVLRAEDEWMDEMAWRILRDCPSVEPDKLSAYPLAARRRVIRLWLVQQGIPVTDLDFDSIARVEALLGRRQGSKTVELAGGWRVQRQYDRVSVKNPSSASGAEKSVTSIRVKVPGVTLVKALGLRITMKLAPGIVKTRGGGPGVFPAQATLSAEGLDQGPLWMRLGKAGDRISPFGMKGSRKIQDILVDAKVPRADRARIPVLICADQVIWLPGYRIDRKWAVDDEAMMNLQVVIEKVSKHNPLESAWPRG
ncbi:MAG: tRNA lysidine(34) synthetase TilS [bacterium]